MQSTIKKAMAVGAALVAGASAQNFRVVGEVYNGTPGSTIKYRTWYGDGNVYVGPHIPEGIQNSLNFTIPDWTGTQPRVLVGPVAPATEEDLPAGTFIAINNAEGATDPVLLTNDETSLSEGYINEWIRYGTYLVPKGLGSTDTQFYLAETEQSGTFKVTWRSADADDEGLQSIKLTAVL